MVIVLNIILMKNSIKKKKKMLQETQYLFCCWLYLHCRYLERNYIEKLKNSIYSI